MSEQAKLTAEALQSLGEFSRVTTARLLALETTVHVLIATACNSVPDLAKLLQDNLSGASQARLGSVDQDMHEEFLGHIQQTQELLEVLQRR